jgi:intracellular sulfur oxidation DsrE/DsrF family protein
MRKFVSGWVLVVFAAFSIAQPRSHRTVVQLSASGPAAYLMVLGNVENLQKAFAPDKITVEVVCLGPGLDLLFASGNPLSVRVKKLSASGVIFAACGNTLRGRHVDKSRLLPFCVVVDSGVAEVVRKQEAGWTYLKGG